MNTEDIADLTNAERGLALAYLLEGRNISRVRAMVLAGIASVNTYKKAHEVVLAFLGDEQQTVVSTPTTEPIPVEPPKHNEQVSEVIKAWKFRFHAPISPSQAQQFLNVASLEDVLRLIESTGKRGGINAPYPYTMAALKRDQEEKKKKKVEMKTTTLEIEEREDTEELREPTPEELDTLRKEQARAYELLARLGLE